MNRRHAKDSSTKDSKTEDLQNHRGGLDHEETTNHNEEQVEIHQRTERSQCRAKSQGTRVSHKDLGRRCVPPEKSEATSDKRHSNEGQVERRRQVVEVLREAVTKLPIPNDGQDAKAKGGRAGGEPVQSVGEIHRIRRGDQHENCQDAPADGSELPAREIETSERQGCRRLDPLHGQHCKRRRNDKLT